MSFIEHLISRLSEEVEYAYFEHCLEEIPSCHRTTLKYLVGLTSMETQP